MMLTEQPSWKSTRKRTGKLSVRIKLTKRPFYKIKQKPREQPMKGIPELYKITRELIWDHGRHRTLL